MVQQRMHVIFIIGGMKLQTIHNASRYECSKIAFLWAKNNGFTHARLEGVKNPYTLALENI